MFTFPGFINDGSLHDYFAWNGTTGTHISRVSDFVWITLSTVITTYAIYKIISIARQLASTNVMTSVNSRTMALHATLLLLQLIVLTLPSVADYLYPYEHAKIAIV